MNLNNDIDIRDTIIFGSYDPEKYMGGVRHYKDLCLDTLEELVKHEFVDTKDIQNDSPTIKHFMLFAERWKKYDITFHGYVVSSDRSDYRFSIEGIECRSEDEKFPMEFILEFTNSFRHADSFILDEHKTYCWYD